MTLFFLKQEHEQAARIDVFGTERGLPAGHEWTTVRATPHGIVFVHARGVSVLDAATDRLVSAGAFDAVGRNGRYIYAFTCGADGTMWVQIGDPTRLFEPGSDEDLARVLVRCLEQTPRVETPRVASLAEMARATEDVYRRALASQASRAAERGGFAGALPTPTPLDPAS